MVTYDELANARLDSLSAAADSFDRLVRQWDVDQAYEGQVINPLASSNWTGPAADNAIASLTRTRSQILAAFDEASSLAATLRDAYDQFSQAQKNLHAAVADAQGKGMTVDDQGQVHWPPATNPADRHDPDYARSYQELADQVSQRISAALEQATQADDAAAGALSADTGDSASFNDRPVGGIPEEEAQQAAALARQGGKLTDAQLRQLDQLLAAHSGDSRFTTAFFQSLGPKESLLFYGQLSWTASGNGANDATRTALLKDLQTRLGSSLATATDTHRWPHLSDEWEAGLRKAGAEKMQTDPNNPDDPQGQVYGYQILGSYLRTGTYDEHFLLPVTEHITQLSEKNPMMWTDGSRENSNLRLNFQDASAGYNPLSGAMEALGHNPRASLDFFHNPETLYGADGTPTGKTAPNGYLDYLTSDSDKNALIIADTTGGGPKEYAAAYKAQVATLGHALQSATTGVPYDAGDGTPLPQHSPEMAALANQVVHRFGSHPELLSGEHNGNPLFSPLNESVAHITGSYIGDVDRSLNNTTTRLPVFGSDAHFNTTDTRQLLHALGRDPDSYGVVLQAQNGYTAAQLQNVAHASDPHDPQLGDVFSNISHDGGVATGILGQARVQELQQNNAASDAQYNAAIDRNTEVAKTVWSMTLGSKVDAVPVVGGALNEGVSSYIDHLADGFHQDSTLKSIHDGNDLDVQAQNATMDAARNAVHHAMQGSGLDSQKIDDYADTAAKGAQNGYGLGAGDDARTQGPYS
ncbi:hypothetical protein [Streptacidiphilus monticola]|uniref:WXG100 family type VII secretion target n=1 Tax=Streptacidiphilus monticola TaxID=2161674 RepID=A0ABW1FZA1_9ACTN